MVRVPPLRLRAVISCLERTESWCNDVIRGSRELRVCADHVADSSPTAFALHPRREDPLWKLAKKEFQDVDALGDIALRNLSSKFHFEIVKQLVAKERPASSRAAPKDRSEIPSIRPRLSKTREQEKRSFIFHLYIQAQEAPPSVNP